ncbi:MAG: cell division protein ZapA [Deltaproteobacteria bacterium]|jgi:cell division protein ZapA|nr:cell division protein ZapA [Deltaproteobacteria bacterium]
MKSPVTVSIGGHRYTLRSDEDERLVREMAAHVDKRLRDLQKQTRAADTQSLAVLTALQITEELWRERRRHSDLKKQVRDKGRALLQFIEREGRV